MRQAWIPLALLTLALGCGDDDNNVNSTEDLTLSEQTEDAAVIVGESVALQSGGLLESLESTLDSDVEGSADAAGSLLGGKDRDLDEAVFDSSACLWTISRARAGESEHAGFSWSQTRTLHFMDELGECVVQRGDSTIRSLDFTRTFAGSSWNQRREGAKSGSGVWALSSLHDAEPGSLVNGTHAEEGESVIHRVRPNGEVVDVSYEYTLQVEGTDLLILRRAERRVPVAGTLHVVYDAVRNGRAIHRDFTVVFGEDGGNLSYGNAAWLLNPVTGELSN
ncbi:MAG: hypothetical protein WC326_14355 [Candidatus Delongbacteria bacterium]